MNKNDIVIIPKTFYVCETCGKTCDRVNKDYECLNCIEELNLIEVKNG